MNRLRSLAISIAIISIANLAVAQTAKKVSIDEETLQILKEQYQVFNQRNVRKLAQREVARTIFYGQDRSLFQNIESVVMPICDVQRPPFEWKYVSPSEDERVLKYVGERPLSAQFLRWTDTVWIRIAGPSEKFREGMYCGQAFVDGPSSENFATIDIDRSFSQNVKNRNTPTELIDAALLQLASKMVATHPKKMRGEVSLAVSHSINNVLLGLEIWSMNGEHAEKIASTWEQIPANSVPRVMTIDAELPQGKQAHLILRLDPLQRDSAAAGQMSGKVFVVDARLYPVS